MGGMGGGVGGGMGGMGGGVGGVGSPSASPQKSPEKKRPAFPRDLAPSNVFTHAEAVLLQWATYHTEHASKLKDEGASSSGRYIQMIYST
jgi:hypothetical protein